MSTPTAITTSLVNLRSGPGAEYSVQTVLEPGTAIQILTEMGDWLQIKAPDSDGYVSRQMVLLAEQRVDDGFLIATLLAEPGLSGDATAEHDQPLADAEAASLPLAPPAFLQINFGSAPSPAQNLVANTWNRYGGLLATLAATLKLDPGVAVAVFGIESGGRGFARDGRLIIRFENHIFFDTWGNRNIEVYNRHFRFHATQRWKAHQWRPTGNQPWRDFHDKQQTEWEVFAFAQTLDERAAKLSISMGGPQIMGFNHASIGYETVHQMFDAFSASERNHVLGFFDFVKGPSGNSRKVLALQDHNFEAFAELYNGSGKGNVYASKMRTLFEVFQSTGALVSIRRVTPERLNLRSTPEIRPDNIIRDLPQATPVILSVVEPVRTAGRVWVRVHVEGQHGWVNGAFLDPVVA